MIHSRNAQLLTPWILVVVTVLGISSGAVGAKRPELPGPVFDSHFEEDGRVEPATATIARHRQDESCRADLGARFESYNGLKTRIRKLVESHASPTEIDGVERQMRSERGNLLRAVERCGPCVTHKIDRAILFLNRAERRTEVWRVSDGSCQLGGTQAERQAAYQKIKRFLLDIKYYPKHPLDPKDPTDDGGFFNVLQFMLVDNTTGTPLPNERRLDRTPEYAWATVRGFNFLGELLSFSYYFRNEFAELTTPDHGHALYMTFNRRTRPNGDDGVAPPMPDGLEERMASQYPAFDFSASGAERTPTKPHKLYRVMGSWYVTEDGYLRYYTAADFGALGKIPLAGDFARDILRDTLVQTVERTDLEMK